MELHIPGDWRAALDRIAAGKIARVAVIGATDVGKSAFVSAALAEMPGAALIDLDPGQKMVGPPGTVSLGRDGRLDRFVFIGSTSAASIRGIAEAAREFRSGPAWVANSAGFVSGLGARLQIATLSALKPDLVVAIGEGLGPILERHPALRLQPSPHARRKSPASRAKQRRARLAEALGGAETRILAGIAFQPAPPSPFPAGPERPVCALADENGRDLCLAILTDHPEGGATIHAPPAPTAAAIRLGRMWAEPHEGEWRLLETLSPAWLHREPEG